MAVSHRQKRWKRAMTHEQGWPHGRPHRRARSASLPTRSATLETSPSATHFTYGLSPMRSASDILAKAAIADLTDWNQWYRHARCVMLRPWFRGGCHACFCRPDGWIPNVLVLCQHEVSPWLLRRTARSAPPSFYPASRKPPPAAAQICLSLCPTSWPTASISRHSSLWLLQRSWSAVGATQSGRHGLTSAASG